MGGAVSGDTTPARAPVRGVMTCLSRACMPAVLGPWGGGVWCHLSLSTCRCGCWSGSHRPGSSPSRTAAGIVANNRHASRGRSWRTPVPAHGPDLSRVHGTTSECPAQPGRVSSWCGTPDSSTPPQILFTSLRPNPSNKYSTVQYTHSPTALYTTHIPPEPQTFDATFLTSPSTTAAATIPNRVTWRLTVARHRMPHIAGQRTP